MKIRDLHFYGKPFLLNLGWCAMGVAMPIQADRFGASIAFIGFMASGSALAYSIGAAFSGGLSDRLGCKRVSVAGTAAMASLLVGVALARTKWELLAFGAAARFCLAFFWPPFHHWTGARADGEPLFKRLQRLCVFLAIGWFLGPLVGGVLYDRVDPRAPFFLAAALCGLVALSLAAEPAPAKGDGPAAPPFDPEVSPARKGAFLGAAWAGVFFGMFSLGVYSALFPKLGESKLGMSPESIGRTMTAGLAFLPLGLYLLGRRSHWHYRADFVACCHVLCAVGLALMFFVRGPIGVFVSFAALNIVFSGFYFSSLYYSLARGAGQGKASGFHEALIGIGSSLGPLLGGLAAGPFGLRAPYAVCLIAQAATVAVQVAIWLRRREKRSVTPPLGGLCGLTEKSPLKGELRTFGAV